MFGKRTNSLLSTYYVEPPLRTATVDDDDDALIIAVITARTRFAVPFGLYNFVRPLLTGLRRLEHVEKFEKLFRFEFRNGALTTARVLRNQSTSNAIVSPYVYVGYTNVRSSATILIVRTTSVF